MTHTLRVREVVRWTEFSEYEGVIHGELDGVPVTCYVLVPATEWDSYRPGTAVEVDAWVERTGGVGTLPPRRQPASRSSTKQPIDPGRRPSPIPPGAPTARRRSIHVHLR